MLDNLVLCHPGCNRDLANRPKADKLKMRDTRMATRARQLSVHPIGKPPAPAKSGPLPSQSSRSLKPSPDRSRLVAAIDRWRRIALGSAAVALFALGLSLGLLVAR